MIQQMWGRRAFFRLHGSQAILYLLRVTMKHKACFLLTVRWSIRKDSGAYMARQHSITEQHSRGYNILMIVKTSAGSREAIAVFFDLEPDIQIERLVIRVLLEFPAVVVFARALEISALLPSLGRGKPIWLTMSLNHSTTSSSEGTVSGSLERDLCPPWNP